MMRFRGSFLAFTLSLVFALPLVSQTSNPQPVPAPNAPAPTSSDPNDSGYTSIFLLNHDWSAGSDDLNPSDDAMLRLEANRQRRGINPDFVGDMLLQAQLQRALNPSLLPGAAAAPGIPLWSNIGPLKSNHIQNGVLRTTTDSGRARTILPHPTNANIL